MRIYTRELSESYYTAEQLAEIIECMAYANISLFTYGEYTITYVIEWADREEAATYGEYEAFACMSADRLKAECEECGEIMYIRDMEYIKLNQTSRWRDDGDPHVFCPTCLEENYYQCDACSKWFELDGEEHEVDGQRYCDDCFCETFSTCEECGDVILSDDALVTENSEVLCESCYREHYARCCCCGHEISRDDSRLAEEDDYCEECFMERFEICDECGEVVRNSDAREMDGNIVCDSCYRDARHNILDHSANVAWVYYPESANRNKDRLGLEIEIDGGGESDSKAGQILDAMGRNRFIIKTDGSLDEGLEIISHPMTLNYILSLNWNEYFKLMLKLGYTAHNNGRCGLHISLSRQTTGTTTEKRKAVLINLLWIFQQWKDELIRFSRRSNGRAEQWAKILSGYDDAEQLYRICLNEGKYQAVSPRNEYRIEIRLWRGTLNVNTFKATCQLTAEIMRLAKRHSLEEIKALTWTEFVLGLKGKYIELDKYLIDKRLMPSDIIAAGLSNLFAECLDLANANTPLVRDDDRPEYNTVMEARAY